MTKTGGGHQNEEVSLDKEPSGDDEEETPAKPNGQFTIRDELLNRTHKFLGMINRTLQRRQIEDEISLHIPELDLDSGVDVLLSDPETLEKLEQCVMNWQTQITIVIEEQQNKKTPGPMGEIVLWQEHASVLSALSEQLKQPAVEKIIEVMTKADAGVVQTLQETIAELTKYRLVSESNVDFLKTLERHFMNLATGADFFVILKTIPDLMESLQIVWMISCHYNTNERMVPLMEKIAWQLCERVAQVIDVHTLFKDKREVAISTVHEAKQVLDQWKSSYFEMRAGIEELGQYSRWEFDRKRLFERSDYMASVCQDLYNVLQILEEFHNIFGPELKNVTGDPKRIDEVLCRVDNLVLPFEEVDFDPFSIFKMSSWKMIMQEFDTTVQAIEGEAINFIDQSFKTLRSSAAAFEMLLKFKHIRSRELVNNHLMKKFNDILAQFCKEVDSINEIFETMKDKPPLSKNEPPVTGAIRWAQFLFRHIKQTILPFLKVPEMVASEQGKAAKDKYVELALRIKDYEVNKYECWQEETEQNLPLLMKKTLLDVPPTEISLERGIRYMVNFAPEIWETISEANYLSALGYSLSDMPLNVALQKDKLIKLVNCYHSVMESLSEAHIIMLAPHIKAVRKVMLFGCKRANWNSIGIPEFITRSIQAVSMFQSLVNQIHNNEKEIDSKLQSLMMANLLKFPMPDKSSDLPGVKKFCEHIERERVKTINLLSRKYTAIGFLITTTEHLIMETSSGKAKCMASYYMYWERKVLDALIQLVLRNIQAFSMTLMGSTALFQVDAILSAPKIVLQPQSNEIYWLIMQCVRDCIDSTKQFVRWMHGTCIESPPQHVGGEDEFVTFSFYSDVCQHPQINESVMTVSQNIQRLLLSVDRYLSHWKRYRPLWERNKTIVNEKFAAKKPSCVMYDNRLQFLARINQEVMLEPLFMKEHIIHLNLDPLAQTVQEIAESWISSLGSLLNKPAKEDLFDLRDELMVLIHAI
uniref:Dynein heavy chain tail domain-containing protein n=1 Tax=Stegastes partitus TaxID=144197 RepID=A0A3B5A058_9TELE